jgi:phosphate uptake regulator
MEDLTKVFASSDPVKAQLIQSLLHRNGVEASVLDKKDSAYVMLGEAAVFVASKDAAKAREIIEEFEAEDENE